jgi:hypothetical protein
MNKIEKIRVPAAMFPVVDISTEWLAERNAIAEKASEITEITSQLNFEQAEILLKKITVTSNKAEKLRKQFAKPFQDFAKKIKKTSDEARQILELEKQRLKNLMAGYLKAEEEKREQAFMESISSESFFSDTPEPAVIIPEEPVKLMTSSRKVWKFEIIEPELVPRNFCSPDESKIRAYLKENKDGANMPGVRFFEELTVQSR